MKHCVCVPLLTDDNRMSSIKGMILHRNDNQMPEQHNFKNNKSYLLRMFRIPANVEITFRINTNH
uniref:Uncharacterized protein n=1 Tax=Heterorhabditis bacteriophora TaxID=37862 RepID=A0A1I7WUF2_HETBA